MQQRTLNTSPWRRVNKVRIFNILRKLYVPLPREGNTALPEVSLRNHLRNDARMSPGLQSLKGAALPRALAVPSWCKDMDTHGFTLLQHVPFLLREENTP